MMQTNVSDTRCWRFRPWTLGLAILAILPGGCQIRLFDSPTATTHRSATVDYQAGSIIQVISRNGSIRVTHDAANTQVAIDADIRCGGLNMEQAEQRAEYCQLTAAYTDDDVLRIEPAFVDAVHHRDGANLQIRVPTGVDLVLSTSNGEIIVGQVQGSTIGTIDAETSNAPIRLAGTQGHATLKTSNGPVHAKQVGGALVVETSNAPITASNVAGELKLQTVNGPITTELLEGQSGPIQATSANAPVTIQVAEGFDGRIDFRTSNASALIRDPQERVREQEVSRGSGFVVLGNGASTSRVTTSNGKIVVQVN